MSVSRPLRVSVTLACAAACAAVFTSPAAPTEAVPVLTFDMPHGHCRVSVQHDGSARLGYGALPEWVQVRPGTFDSEALLRRFRTISRPQQQRDTEPLKPLKPPIGAVTFGLQSEPRLFNDEAFATALLRRAWEFRVPPRNASERLQERSILRFCAAPPLPRP
jgi:hypothetical protein